MLFCCSYDDHKGRNRHPAELEDSKQSHRPVLFAQHRFDIGSKIVAAFTNAKRQKKVDRNDSIIERTVDVGDADAFEKADDVRRIRTCELIQECDPVDSGLMNENARTNEIQSSCRSFLHQYTEVIPIQT